MPQISITQLPQAQALTGFESVPIVQNGVTVQTTTGQIAGTPNLGYSFLTATSEPALAQSRYLTVGSGLSLTDGGAASSLQVNLTGAAQSLNASPTGIQVKTGSNTVTGRSLAVGAGLSVSNASGVAGDPTISLGTLLSSFASQTGTGILAIQSGSVGKVNILGVASQTSVTNGNGSADVTVGLANNAVFPGSGSVTLPVGTTGQRVTNTGAIRYNTDFQQFEGYTSTGWNQFSLTGGVTSFSGGSTGLLPNTATTGAITLSGTLVPASGGTGASTLSGYVYGNGTATMTASLTIPTTDLSGTISNAQLANSSLTVNGTTISLGGSGTISSVTTNTLTIGTGLSGGSFNGSSPVTIAIDSTVATLTGLQTLTNKSISGSSNTLTNIANSSLTNSAVTFNGVTVSLGGSGTITASTTAALTAGTGLQLNSGTTFDGAIAKTISIDSTVATLTGLQTLTNKSISGSSNTLTNIPNSALTNSSITIGSTSVSLGGTAATVAGLTLTTPTIAQILNTGTLTLPTSTDTLVGRATTDTLTNKSISGSSNTLTNIPNSALTNSSITLGTTNIALGGTSLAPAGLTSVTVTQDPSTALQLATKQYVDGLASTGLYYHAPVQAATTQSLAAQTGGTVTYNNGTGGVGATITLSVALTTLDGYSLVNGDRILVKNEVNQAYNGVYTWATGGTVLTRSTDTDSYGPGTGDLSENDYFFVQNGNVNKGTSYVCTTAGTITFGTTAITFAQFSTSQVYTAGTGLTLTNTTFSITNTGVTASTYGSASVVPVFAVNAQGQLTSVTNTSIAIAASQVTSGTLAVAQGGTNIASYTIGDLLYASGATALSKLGIGASGAYLSSSGTAPQWSSPAALTKTDDTNVTLTLGGSPNTALLNAASLTLGWTGQLATGRGGTGLSSYTAGDLVYYAAGTALSKLAIGASTYILTSSGTAPQWSVPSSITVGTATNATNTAITANSTNAANYLTFVSATTGNLPQLVNSSITCNPSNGTITGGIAGGSF